MKKLRVLVVDDVPSVREGLRTVLELHGGFQVVGQAANGVQAVELAARLLPDVILMDLNMPEMDGYQATKEIIARGLPSTIVAMSIEDDAVAQLRARQAGAAFLATKGGSACHLGEKIYKNLTKA